MESCSHLIFHDQIKQLRDISCFRIPMSYENETLFKSSRLAITIELLITQQQSRPRKQRH